MSRVVILLKRKLITCDSVVPLALDIHNAAPSTRIDFYAPDKQTYDDIRRNRVLADAIDDVGTLRITAVGRGVNVPRLVRRLLRLLWLLKTATVLAATRPHVIHFGSLNHWPFRLLWLVNPSKTLLCESSPWRLRPQYSSDEQRTVMESRQQDDNRRTWAGSALIVLDGHWLESLRLSIHLPKYHYGPPHLRRVWIERVRERADEYIDADIAGSGGDPDEELVVYILGFLGYQPAIVRSPSSLIDLIGETLDILLDEIDLLPIVLKPHPVTDEQELRRALHSYVGNRVVVSHVHPQFLASRARFFIANKFSTTFPDATCFGVPTIEYGDYTDTVIAATNGQSHNPEHVDYFINRDPRSLRAAIRAIMGEPPKARFPLGHERDPSGLVKRLSS